MEENKKAKKTILILFIFALLIFIVTTVGSTFAFFTFYVRGNEDSERIELESADILVVYEGNTVIAENILPGWEEEMEITLKNITEGDDVVASYSLNWEIEKNEINDDALVYTINCKSSEKDADEDEDKTINTSAELKVPNVSSSIGTGLIESDVTHTCKIKIRLKETGSDQNHLQNKKLQVKVIATGNATTTEYKD